MKSSTFSGIFCWQSFRDPNPGPVDLRLGLWNFWVWSFVSLGFEGWFFSTTKCDQRDRRGGNLEGTGYEGPGLQLLQICFLNHGVSTVAGGFIGGRVSHSKNLSTWQLKTGYFWGPKTSLLYMFLHPLDGPMNLRAMSIWNEFSCGTSQPP